MKPIVKSQLQFIFRSFLLAVIPLVLLWVWFYVSDPLFFFRPITDDQHIPVVAHKGIASTLNFERQQPVGHFDSFIFGSSLTMSTPADEWQKYLPEGSRPFHYDASAMTIEQMCEYLEYLTKRADVKNLYIILNRDWLKFDRTIFVTAPQVSGRWRDAVSLCFNTWRESINPSVLLGFSTARRVNHWPWIIKYTNTEDYLVACNVEMQHPDQALLDEAARLHGCTTFEEYKQKYPPVVGKPVLDSLRRGYLQRFADILEKEGTDYRVALVRSTETPSNANMLLLNPADSIILREIYGDRFISAQWPTYPWIYDVDATFDCNHFTPESAVKLLRYVYDDSLRNAHPGRL